MSSKILAIIHALTDNLRKKKYKGNPNKLTGHCYVASEAFYHLSKGNKWKPMFIYHENEPHWFLQNRKTGKIVDITAGQFKTLVPYGEAKGKGFLTKTPSRRCLELIDRIKKDNGNENSSNL